MKERPLQNDAREDGLSRRHLLKTATLAGVTLGSALSSAYSVDDAVSLVRPREIMPYQPILDIEETGYPPLTELRVDDSQAVADEVNMLLARLFNEDGMTQFGPMSAEYLLTAQDEGRLSVVLAHVFSRDKYFEQRFIEVNLQEKDGSSLFVSTNYLTTGGRTEDTLYLGDFESTPVSSHAGFTSLEEIEDEIVNVISDGEYEKETGEELIIFPDSITQELHVDIKMKEELHPVEGTYMKARINKNYRFDSRGRLSASYNVGMTSE